jgi:hypothetical protein
MLVSAAAIDLEGGWNAPHSVAADILLIAAQ